VLRHRLRITDVVVDALLGTGVSRPIGGTLAELLQQVKAVLSEQTELRRKERLPALISVAAVERALTGIANEISYTDDADRHSTNASRINADFHLRTTRNVALPYVVAVDCPSGLNCDTGELDPLAVPADLTVTFAGPKRGHFRFPGAAACGELVVANIGIAAELPEVAAVPVELATAEMARALFPARPLNGHKGTFGTVLIIAGSAQYWGAPVLAARGALRAGAGLVALAVPEAIRPTVAMQLPEATYPVVGDWDVFGAESVELLWETAKRSKACLVGPGLGGEAADFLESFLQSHDELPPLVVDADGLNLLAKMASWPRRLPAGTILTPHPGEMERLMGVELVAIRAADRVELACEKAAEWGHVVVLKGAYTVIAAPDGRCALLPFANPIMATGGTGDVLAGVIVSLLAQGLAGFEAAVLGGYWHGAAGQLAAQKRGNAGLLAGELADWLIVARHSLFERF
jgi:NAD(P)H-hydrate epimerase